MRLERRRLVGLGVVAAVDHDVGAVREGRDAGDQRGGVRAVRAAAGPRRCTTPVASRCSPVAAEHDRAELLGVHEHEPHAGVVDQAGQQVGPLPLDRLQLDPARVSANDTIARCPETTQTTPGATRVTSPGSPGAAGASCRTRAARSTRCRSRRAIGPRASASAAVDLPALGRPAAVLRAAQGSLRGSRRVDAAQPADQLLDRLPEPVGERLSPGSARGRTARPGGSAGARAAAGPVQPADLLVDAAQHARGCRPARCRSGGRPRRSRGSRRRRQGRPASMSSMIAETTTSRAITSAPGRASG